MLDKPIWRARVLIFPFAQEKPSDLILHCLYWSSCVRRGFWPMKPEIWGDRFTHSLNEFSSLGFTAQPHLLRSGWWSCWQFQSNCPYEGYKLQQSQRLLEQQNHDSELGLPRHKEIHSQPQHRHQLLVSSLMQLQPTFPNEKVKESTSCFSISPDSDKSKF